MFLAQQPAPVGQRLHRPERADRSSELLRPTVTMISNRPGSRRSLRGPAAAAALAAGLLATLASGGCGTSAAATGKALTRGNTWTFGLVALRPGAQEGLLDATVHNQSRSPLVISSITLTGRGFGTVIKLVEVKIAPPETGRNGTPGGAFEVYPPTVYWTVGGTCNQQVLVTVRGYRLAPGKEARVWFLVQAGRSGTFHVRGDVVRYRQHGVNYQQFIPTGYQGSVAAHAPFVPIDPLEKRCLKSVKNARLLPGHYLTKPKHYG